jgi:hypothetical protein
MFSKVSSLYCAPTELRTVSDSADYKHLCSFGAYGRSTVNKHFSQANFEENS